VPKHYIERTIEPLLLRSSQESPAIVLTGPRQSGKTTLLKHVFSKTHRYISLDLPDVAASATADPRGFLDINRPPVIFDEIQYVPGLLPYIKELVDADRQSMGRFILTGSQNLMLLNSVTETLAGRAALLRLLPLSYNEALGRPLTSLPWESKKSHEILPELTHSNLYQKLIIGSFPELVATPKSDPTIWQGSYIQTYLERDVRSLRHIGDLSTFQNFLRVIAARSGQLFQLADVSRDLGVAFNTAKQWLSILEATYQVVVVRPYFENVGKRLVKTPKVYYLDTGLLAYLAQIRDADQASTGPFSGAFFETAVLAELTKSYVHRGKEARIFFWRTAAGKEVDFVIEVGGTLIPIEVKASATPRPEMTTGLRSFMEDYSPRANKGYVVHPGNIRLPLAPDIEALPFALL